MSRAPRVPRWAWVLAAWGFVQYTVAGAWLLFGRHWAIHDAVSRTLTAKLMVLSRDPHLGAINFYWMPLPSVARIPFVLLLAPFDRVELAGPMASSAFCALTVPVLAKTGRLLGLTPGWVVAIVVTFAFSPVTVYLGASGMSESAAGFFIALTMYCFLRWRQDGSTTSLMLTGLALAGSAMCRYETLLFMVVLGVAVGWATERGRRYQAVVLMLLPSITVFAWWALASKLIMGDWFFWYTYSRYWTATPGNGPWLPDDRSLVSLFGYSGIVVIALAPALAAVVAGSLANLRRWRTSLAVLGVIVVVPAFVTVQTYTGSSWAVPRFYELSPLLVTIGVMWVFRAGRGTRSGSWWGALGVVLLAAGAVTGSVFLSSRTSAYAEGEYAFFGPLLGKEPSAATVDDDGPVRVFEGDLRPYYRLRDELDPLLAEGATVAMPLPLRTPALLTSHPKQYIVPEDRDFEQILADPVGRVDYIVATTSYVVPTSDLGDFVEVRDYSGLAVLYQWVPNGGEATFDPPPS